MVLSYNNLFGLPIKDTQCGFKAFRYKVAKKIFPLIECDHFAFDIEVLLLARHFHYTYKNLPVVWHDIAGSTVNLWLDPLKNAQRHHHNEISYF